MFFNKQTFLKTANIRIPERGDTVGANTEERSVLIPVGHPTNNQQVYRVVEKTWPGEAIAEGLSIAKDPVCAEDLTVVVVLGGLAIKIHKDSDEHKLYTAWRRARKYPTRNAVGPYPNLFKERLMNAGLWVLEGLGEWPDRMIPEQVTGDQSRK